MDTKTLIASEIAKVVPELEQDAIFNLLETPKILTWETLPFQLLA